MAQEGEPLLRGWALTRLQLRATLFKQGNQKRRGWPQTLLEITSPVLIMLALVWAHHLSRATYFTEHVYAGDLQRLTQNVTTYLVDVLEGNGVLNCMRDPMYSLTQALPPLSASPLVEQQLINYTWAVGLAATTQLVAQGYPRTRDAQGHEVLVGDWVTGEGLPDNQVLDTRDIPVPPELQAAAKQAGKVLVDTLADVMSKPDIQQQVAECSTQAFRAVAQSLLEMYMLLINNKGPLPVFTLDEYLMASRLLKAAMQSNPQVEAVLYSFKRDFGWNWLGNLVGTGKLAFTPDTPQVRALVQNLTASHEYFADAFLGILPIDQIEQMKQDGFNFWAVVEFAHGPEPGGSADYTIRMSFLETPETYVPIDKFSHWSSRRFKMYLTSGFFSIESAINAYILGQPASTEATFVVPQCVRWNVTHKVPPSFSKTLLKQPYAIWTSAFPKPGFLHNPFYEAVGPMLGLLMCLALIFPLAMLIRGMVEEKETQLREVLCIMGLKPSVLLASWCITYTCVFTCVTVGAVLVSGTTFLSHTSWSLLLVYFLTFCMSELAFGVLLSTFFSRAKVSAIAGPLLHFITVMPRYAFYKTAASQAIGSKLAVCLLSPSAFTFGMDLIAAYEGAGGGMTWADIWSDPLPLGATLIMMLIDTCLYMLLAAYLDKVIPSGYGPTLPFTFPCQPKYWRKLAAGAKQLLRSSTPQSASYQLVEGAPLLGEGRDAHGSSTARGGVCVDIQHLHMRYPNGVWAVRDLSLQMHMGQITGLLGHNGAGKSTTVAMMTGLLVPTAGDVLIDGHSITHDTAAARLSLGLCPQQDVLVPRLTVLEHLVMMAAIKGVPGWDRCKEDAHNMRATVGLAAADESSAASACSGGMKRKLQMGMALIGGSKVIIADEPTSGMDPTARRSLWQVLRAVRPTRSILLTTHYMDEADLLSDHIVIMSGGRLKASGSGLELKEGHGGAYTLSITLNPSCLNSGAASAQQPESQHAQQGHSGRASVGGLEMFKARVCREVERVVRQVELVRHAGTELALRLPAASSHLFPKLLQDLDDLKTELHISHCSISMPTLEEVFLNLTSSAPSHVQGSGHGSAPSREPHARKPPVPQPRDSKSTAISTVHEPLVEGGIELSRVGRRIGQKRAPSRAPDSMFTIHDDDEGSSDTDSISSTGSLGRADDGGRVGQQQQQDGEISYQVAAGGASRVANGAATASNGTSNGLDKWLSRLGTNPGVHQGSDTANTLRSNKEVEAEGEQDVEMGRTGVVRETGGPGQTGRAGAGRPGKAPDSNQPHAWRCFKLMLAKRALIASRDWKGLLYLFLLPVAAVAATLLILLLNIDPTGPRLLLSLHSTEQYTPVPMVHNPAPSILSGCLGPIHPLTASSEIDASGGNKLYQGWVPKYHFEGTDSCPSGMSFKDVPNVTSSYTLSDWLLKGLHNASQPPQYAAFVWSDPIVLKGPVEFWLASRSAGRRVADDLASSDVDVKNLLAYLRLVSEVPSGLSHMLTYAADSKLDPETVANVILPALKRLLGRNAPSRGRGLLDMQLRATAGRRLQDHAAPTAPAQPRATSAAGDVSPDVQVMIEAALVSAGMDPVTAKEITGYLGQLDDPEVRSQLIDKAAGDDTALKAQLTASLADGLPTDPQQLLHLVDLILQGPLGQGLAGGGGGGGLPAGADAFEQLLAGLLQDSLGISNKTQAQRLVQVLVPLVIGLAQSGDQGVDLRRVLSLNLELGRMQRVSAGFAARMDLPPVTLMFNSSSWHSLMAAYTDMSQALANIDWAAAESRAAQVAAGGLTELFNWQGSDWSKNISTLDRTLKVTNHPLPLTHKETLAIDTFISILAAIFCMIPWCYLAGAYCVSPVNEGASGSRALQVGSGCRRTIYWAGSYTWDLVLHAAVSVVALATFAAFGDPSTTGTLSQALATLLLLLGYGAGCIPLSYCMSLGFSSASSAQVSVSVVNFVLGFMFVVGSETMKGIEECVAFQRVAVHFCRLLPPFNLGEGLISLSAYRLFTMLAQDLEPAADGSRGDLDSLIPPDAIREHAVPKTPFDWSVLGRNLCALYGSALLYFLLAVFLDSWRNDPFLSTSASRAAGRAWQALAGLLQRASGSRQGYATLAVQDVEMQAGRQQGSATGESAALLGTRGAAGADQATSRAAAGVPDAEGDPAVSDVMAEAARVASGSQVGAATTSSSDALVIQQLSKVYPTRPPKIAVKGLSLGVAPGERFGLLGANGAGKSSTLKILSGQAAPTSGAAFVNGVSVISAAGMAAEQQQLVGYCPQVDPLLELLTGWEQLRLFASVKGTPEPDVHLHVPMLLSRVGLPNSMWHRPAGTLSGGNKRKLSLAIALVGSPALVLLDEPSSGMDPGARRMMWDAILRATQPHEPHPVDAASGGQASHTSGPASTSAAALLLTTHYLEEAEALCDRVAIMNKGEMRCLGTPLQLKLRYGAAYNIEIRCDSAADASSAEPVDVLAHTSYQQGSVQAVSEVTVMSLSPRQQMLVDQIQSELPGFRVEEVGWGSIRAALPTGPGTPPMAFIFKVLEGCKVRPELGVLSYSVSQPSLEAVFLRVCGQKLDEAGEYLAD